MSERGHKGKGWKFTARERRAVLFLIPLVAVLLLIAWGALRPRFDDSATVLGDTFVNGNAVAEVDHVTGKAEGAQITTSFGVDSEEVEAGPLFTFDPNTATYEEFRALGIAKNTAAGIIKYRTRGKVFSIPEDFATCYGVTDSMYAALKPYISIGEEFAIKPSENRSGSDTRQRSGQNITSESDRGGNPAISVVPESKPQPYLVELNTADSASLVSVRGIGAKSAAAILDYRNRLGGFHSAEQLAELKVITEQNYERIIEQIWVDSCEIQKIDINFASPNTVAGHPYMAGKKARKILKNRQMKGGWSTIEEMIEDHTLTSEEAALLAPYLHFTAN